MRHCTARHIALAFLAVLATTIPVFGADGTILPGKSADELYKSYEALNTPANLGTRFIGGDPPRFVKEQIRILLDISGRKTAESSRVLLRITDEYLARVEKLGPARFRTSPLQSLQITLVQALGAKADSPGFQSRLEQFVKSKSIREFTKGRALQHLTALKIHAVDPAQDPDSSKRGAIILSDMLDNLDFSACLHAPARFAGIASLTQSVVGLKPNLVWESLKSADSLPRRYARDFAFAAACFPSDAAQPEALAAAEKTRLIEIIGRWIKEYRPLVAKESYPSDVLERALRNLAALKGNEDLAKLLPPVETPKPAGEPAKP